MKDGFLRVAVANPEIRVADTERNAEQIIKAAKAASKKGVEVLVFPELTLTGSTCGDLFYQPTLLGGAERALEKIIDRTASLDTLIFVGLPVRYGGKLYSACAAVQGGELLCLVPKQNPAKKSVFTESLIDGTDTVDFAGDACIIGDCIVNYGGVSIGIELGEDLQSACPPSSLSGAMLTVNLAATCEVVGMAERRRGLVESQSLRTISGYVYADAGRGESTTDMVFAGHGIIAEAGRILAENKPFDDRLLTVADIDTDKLAYERLVSDAAPQGLDGYEVFATERERSDDELMRKVSKYPFVPQKDIKEKSELILGIQAEGLRTRLAHTGVKKLVLGVSGGLDSALALLVCIRALDSLKKPRTDLIAVSMPCFGTSGKTANNAELLSKAVGADYRVVDIRAAVTRHLEDISHPLDLYDTAYENAQARMRTMVLMDIGNVDGGLVVGTGDLSEEALGWCTYGGDHLSMYGVNASVPKTLVRHLVKYEAERIGGDTQKVLESILGTDVSPELLPPVDGKISQKTEEIIGKYTLNDFFLYHAVKLGLAPQKVLVYAAAAFGGKADEYKLPLAKFYRRFFAAQFKRSCCPDGAKTGFSLSPRGDWSMPSDASAKLWVAEVENASEDKK